MGVYGTLDTGRNWGIAAVCSLLTQRQSWAENSGWEWNCSVVVKAMQKSLLDHVLMSQSPGEPIALMIQRLLTRTRPKSAGTFCPDPGP